MKVNHIITTIQRGGAENQLLVLVNQQLKEGLVVRIYPLKGELELEESFEALGAEINLSLYNLTFLRQVLRLRKKLFLDDEIVHCHLPQAELLVSMANIKRYIVTRHFGGQFWPGSRKFISSFLSRYATRGAASVIAISNFVKSTLINLNEIKNQDLINVVHYGFNPEAFLSGIETPAKNVVNDKVIIGTMARLSSEKDLPTLLNAMNILLNKKKIGNIELKIFGEGDQRNELELQIEQLKIRNRVELCGRTQTPAIEMRKFSIFIFCSKFEGFGMVLLEALSLGLPIICSNFETALEILGDSGAAIYFNTGDPQDLAKKVESYLAGELTISVNAQQARLQEFSLHKLSSETLRIYTQVKS